MLPRGRSLPAETFELLLPLFLNANCGTEPQLKGAFNTLREAHGCFILHRVFGTSMVEEYEEIADPPERPDDLDDDFGKNHQHLRSEL